MRWPGPRPTGSLPRMFGMITWTIVRGPAGAKAPCRVGQRGRVDRAKARIDRAIGEGQDQDDVDECEGQWRGPDLAEVLAHEAIDRRDPDDQDDRRDGERQQAQELDHAAHARDADDRPDHRRDEQQEHADDRQHGDLERSWSSCRSGPGCRGSRRMRPGFGCRSRRASRTRASRRAAGSGSRGRRRGSRCDAMLWPRVIRRRWPPPFGGDDQRATFGCGERPAASPVGRSLAPTATRAAGSSAYSGHDQRRPR